MTALGGPGDGALDAAVARWTEREAEYRDASWAMRDARILVKNHGARAVVITAPHAGHQTRGSWAKPADGGTGGLAEVLAQLCHCTAVTVIGRQLDDPNWDQAPGEFKNTVLRSAPAAEFAFDIHGMNRERAPDICIGTGASADAATLAFAQQCAALARASGFAVSVNHPFAASRAGTMTSFAQASGYRALQIEVNARSLDPGGDPVAAAAMLDLLRRLVVMAPRGGRRP